MEAVGEEVRRKLTGRAAIEYRTNMHHIRTYTITIYPAPGGRLMHAVCHALPDCAVVGRDRREALELIEDQIRARIAQATLERKPIPEDRTSTKFIWLDVEEFLV